MRRFILPLLALLGLVLAVPATAFAVPTLNGTFPTVGTLSENPKYLTQAPDGNIWVALTTKVAKVTPDGAVTEFDPPDLGNPGGITAGPDGNLWATQANGVVRFSPADPLGTDQAFTVNDLADPRDITAGPDGNLWAASTDKVIKITTAGVATPFTVTGMSARGIASSGGLLWVADFTGRIISVTTAGVPTPHTVGGNPQEVGPGPGNQILYANPGSNPQTIGRLTSGGSPLTTNVPGTDPFGIAFGADGAYWIAQFATNNLGRLTPDGQYTTPITFGGTNDARHIAAGPNNTLWVALEQSKKIARITGVDPPGQPPTGQQPPTTRDLRSPITRALAFTATIFRRGSLLARLLGARRGPPTGTTISFRVDEQSRTTLTFYRLLPGRRVGRLCLANTRPRRFRPRCTRFVRVSRTLTYTTRPGLHRIRFQGRLTSRFRLAPGRYELRVQAVDAARNRSRVLRKRFILLPELRRR